MIIYATKQTLERYKLKTPEEYNDPWARTTLQTVYAKEHGDRLLEWGAKLFYFDRRKCVQVCNFASKFTIVLADIKVSEIKEIGKMIGYFLYDIYDDDKKTTALIERYFDEHPFVCIAKLTDRSIISTLNRMQSSYLYDGYRLYDYIEGNILHTRKLNKKINEGYPVTITENGKTRYIYPKEEFAELIGKRYAEE